MKKAFILVLAILQVGCASVTYRTNENFESYFNKKKKVSIFTPDMKIFKLTAGGIDQYQDEWSIKATNFMKEELRKELDTFDTIEFNYLDKSALNKHDKEFIDEQKGIFYIVAHSIIAHTYEPGTLFKHKIEDFDYTLGEELGYLNNLTDAEAILLVNGRNYIWTVGRSSLAVLSTLVTLATGVYLPVPARQEWLTASLVDIKSGDILWFNYLRMPGDMRMPNIDRRLIQKLFRDFPEDWRNEERLREREQAIEFKNR